MEILCVLAHQDDEMAMGGRILDAVRAGDRVRCVYLTDGGGWGTEATTRDDESRAVLAALGVPAEDLFVVGGDRRVPDGQLAGALEPTWDHLRALTEGWSIDELWCPAYEGGHMDHDAANLLALPLADALGVAGGVRQFPLYNGWGTRGPLFRVMHPSPGMGPVDTRRLTLAEGWRVVRLVRHYRSQRRTWLGLTPEAFVKLVVLRREYSSPARPEAVGGRPHPGPLFYERRFATPYADWRNAADAFAAHHGPWSG